ncbi:MAG TPA: radical SAM protein [Chitinophagales bacterium]|nr:radical SAM protein [Chitinophagales bacterium]
MQILLTTLNAKYIHTNLAIRILYQLNKEYDGLDWKEFTINEDKQPVVGFCANYDIVAFSCYIWNITQTLHVAQQIKQKKPTTKILLGGPEVSYEYIDIIALDYVDYIIVGEGETPFNELLRQYPDVEFVSGLVYKKDGEVIENKTPSMFELKNFEEIMPYADDDISTLQNKVLYIETSRGCPYKCEFCLASLDNKVRYLPNNTIKQTLLYMMQHGKVVKFLDRTFNIKKDFTIDIFQFILDNHQPHNVFQFEITADIIHPDIIAFIQEKVPIGLFRFEIGIQTVNQKANLQVSRKQNFDKTKKIIQALDNKIEMHLDLIVGLALDEFEDIKYSFEEVFKLFAPELQLGFLKFLKGTPVRDKYEQHGFVFDPNPPYQIIRSNYLSEDQLHQITLLEHALEIYWNKKRIIHTLKYITEKYSIFDFILGLGTYFSSVKDIHKYTLKDVYEIIFQYAENQFPNDVIMKELIAVDYYLQHKIKPQILFLQEISKAEKNQIIEQHGLNVSKYRFIILPLHFNYNLLKDENKIVLGDYHLIIQYTGTTQAVVIPTELAEII